MIRFGELDKVQMVLDGHSGRSRGFAFVYYRNIEDATEVSYAYRTYLPTVKPGSESLNFKGPGIKP